MKRTLQVLFNPGYAWLNTQFDIVTRDITTNGSNMRSCGSDGVPIYHSQVCNLEKEDAIVTDC